MSDFDKILREKMRQHASDMPNDMWSKIESELSVEPTKRKFGLWWSAMAGTAILLLIGAIYIAIGTQSSNGGEQLSLSENHTQSINDKSNLDQSLETKSINRENQTTEQSKATATTLLGSQNQKEDSANFDPTTSKKSSINKISSSKNNNPGNVNSWDNNRTDASQSQNESLTQATSQAATNFEQSAVDISMNRESTNFKENSNSTEKIAIAENDIRLVYEEIRGLRGAGHLRLDYDEDKAIFALAKEMEGMKTECPSFANKELGIFVETYYSNDFGLKFLSENGVGSSIDNYKDLRSQTEQSLYSFSAGLRVGMMIGNDYSLKIGANYSQINEKFEFKDPDSYQSKKIEITNYIRDENNMIIDSTTTIEEIFIPGRTQLVNYNKFRIIDIPILFSYHWNTRSKLSYSVSAGPYINLRLSQKGKFISPDKIEPVDFTSNNETAFQAFNTSIGTSLFGSFSANYALSENLSIFAEPSLRYYMMSFTSEDYPLDQNYLTLSLGMGARVKF